MTVEQFDKDFENGCEKVTSEILKKHPNINKKIMRKMVKNSALATYITEMDRKQIDGTGMDHPKGLLSGPWKK